MVSVFVLRSRIESLLTRWIFNGEKILSTPSFRWEVKPDVPCRKTLNDMLKIPFKYEQGTS
jgi:hypothetical protein